MSGLAALLASAWPGLGHGGVAAAVFLLSTMCAGIGAWRRRRTAPRAADAADGSAADPIQIFVRGLDGRSVVYNISRHARVADVKQRVEQRAGLPADQMRLVFTGRDLDNTLTLSECGVEPDTTLTMLLRLRGGMRARGAAARRAAGKGGGASDKKKKKTAGLFTHVNDPNEGLTLPAERFDLHGHGPTFRSRKRELWRFALFVYEQTVAARKFIESAFFFVYLGLFTAAALMVMHGEVLHDHNTALVNVLTDREWYNDTAFIRKTMYDVDSVNDLWDWLRGPLINEVLPTSTGAPWDAWQGYNTSRPGNFHANLWLLTPIALRQLRVRSDSCEVTPAKQIAKDRTELNYRLSDLYVEQNHLFSPKLGLDAYVSPCKEIDFEPPPSGCGTIQTEAVLDSKCETTQTCGQVGLVPGCYADFNNKSQATDPYGPLDPTTRKSKWMWKSAQDLKSNPWVGRSNVVYPGSGYRVTVSMNPEQAREDVKYLEDNQWLDLATRALFIDLLLYNPNHGFVSLAKLSFEFRPGQETLKFATWKHMSINQLYWNDDAILQMRFELAVFVMVLIFVAKEVYYLAQMKRTYFYNGWHYMAIFNYWLYIIGFGFRVTPFVEASELGFPPTVDEYANYEHAFQAGENWRYCMAINCVIAWIRSFEHFRAFPFMGYMIKVLASAVSPVLVVSISFAIVSFSFALAYVLAFAGDVHEYRTLSWTSTSLVRQLQGLDDFEQLWESNRVLGPVYFFLWTLIGGFVLVSLFVVVLLQEAGDISRQFNLDIIVRKLAKVVRSMKLQKKNESLDAAKADSELQGINSELETAVRRQLEKEGRAFNYAKTKEAQGSKDEFLKFLDNAAKAVDLEFCEVTKQKLREIDQIVEHAGLAVDAINQKFKPDHKDLEKIRGRTVKTAHSIRSLTGSIAGGMADVRKLREHLLSRGSTAGSGRDIHV